MTTDRQFEVFLATIEHQSMRAAADVLGISQPSVSKHIRALEQALGEKLFNRRRGAKIVLSPQGMLLEQEIRDLHERKTRLLAGSAGQENPPILTIYIRNYLFARLEDRLLEFGPLDNGTQVIFESVGNMVPIMKLVGEDANSAALMRSASIESGPDVASSLLSVDSASIYASSEWLAELDPDTDALSAARVLVPGNGELREWTLQQLFAVGVSQEQIVETQWYPAAIVKKVLAGEAVTVFLNEHVKPYVDNGKMSPLHFSMDQLFLQLVSNRRLSAQIVKQLETRLKRMTE